VALLLREGIGVAMTYDEIKIFTDGGSRGNPGPAASGVAILTTDDEIIEQFGRFLGETTNNVAEWSAVKFALEEATKYEPQRIQFFMDSELVCRQLNGRYRVKHPGLIPIFEEVVRLAKGFGQVTYQHVYRADNKLADAQVNIAIDAALGIKRRTV
jgi:ribonuclease HI